MLFTNQEHEYAKLPDRSDIVHIEPDVTGIRTRSTGEVLDFPIACADVFISDDCLVSAGTNGYQGGDAGHGGRTYIRIVMPQTYGFSTNRSYDYQDGTTTYEIVGAGDWELQVLHEALRFIVNTLDDQTRPT